MKRTKIVCTVGPATSEVETLKKLMKAGMNVARINFSHGGYEEQEKNINSVKKAREEVGLPVALLLDTQGPEIRTGQLAQSPVTLVEGNDFILVNEDIIGDENKASVTYKDLYKDVKPGTTILVDDGKLELTVTSIDGKDVKCKIINGGKLGSKKSINIPGTHINLPALKEKDVKDLIDGCKADFDYIAASFIRTADDVRAIRKVLNENGGKDIKIISKIESQEGIDNFDEILEETDGIMVARGDLGVEIPMEQVPIAQKSFIKKCNKAGKIVITATQMLESMTENPRPTRAEVSDVANAVYDVTSAIMLSGETAMGKYPIICVETMAKIAETIEKDINYGKRIGRRECDVNEAFVNYEFYLNYAICGTARQMNATAIFAYTQGGDTPRIISSFMPNCPIFAVTDNKKTYRQLALVNNVTPILISTESEPKKMITEGISQAKKLGFVNDGDIVAVAGGDTILAKETDIMNRTIGGIVRV